MPAVRAVAHNCAFRLRDKRAERHTCWARPPLAWLSSRISRTHINRSES